MLITLNGEKRDVEAADVAGLVRVLSLDPAKIAVEVNRALVPRSLHAETPLKDGDRVEVVQFVGGG